MTREQLLARWLDLTRRVLPGMADDALQRAVAVAERIVADPAVLPNLNDQSLAWRRAGRHL